MTAPSLRRRERSVRSALERLADWLLEQSVSFRRLDGFRQELGLEEAAMAKLLGISAKTYALYRRRREVKLSNRDQMHESVVFYLQSAEASQNGRNEAVLGGLARALHGVTARLAFRVDVASRTTPAAADWEHSPHLWLALEGASLRHEREQGRDARLRELRELHGAGCECSLCAALDVVSRPDCGRFDALARPAQGARLEARSRCEVMAMQVSANQEVSRLEAERDRVAASGSAVELDRLEAALEVARRKVARAEAAERGAQVLEQERLHAEEAARVAKARARAQSLAGERADSAAAVDAGLGTAVAGMRQLQANAIALGQVLGELGRRDAASALEEALWRSFAGRLRGVFARHPLPDVAARKCGNAVELDAAALRSLGLEVK